MEARAVDWEDVLRMYPLLSKSTIEEEMRQGRFPRRRQFSAKRTGWLMSDIEAWEAGRPFSDLPPPPNTSAKKPRRAGAAGRAVPA